MSASTNAFFTPENRHTDQRCCSDQCSPEGMFEEIFVNETSLDATHARITLQKIEGAGSLPGCNDEEISIV